MSQYTQYGYLAGGSVGIYATAALEKVSFDTGISTFLNSTSMVYPVCYAAGLSEGIKKGYVAGGSLNYTYSDRLQLISFFVDTVSLLNSATLVYPRIAPAGVDGDGTKGYVCGGYGSSLGPLFPVDTVYNLADRITYSSDTSTAVTTANITLPRYGSANVSNQTTKGYVLGGFTTVQNNTSFTAYADILDYSTETSTGITSANLALARGFSASMSNPSLAGYVSCGGGNFVTYQTDKLTYSTDTTAALTSASVNWPLYASSGISGSGSAFIAGGADYSIPYPSFPTRNYKLDFTTETISTDPTWFLIAPRRNMAAMSGYTPYGMAVGDGYVVVDGLNYITNCKLIFYMDGTITISGGDRYRFILPQVGSGDITLSGDAACQRLDKWSRQGSGEIVLSGDALYRGPIQGFGTITISGDSTYKISYNNLAQGGTVYLSGSAKALPKIQVPPTPITPTGSLVPVFAATTGGSSTYMPDLALSADGVTWVNYLLPDGLLTDRAAVYAGNDKLLLIRFGNQYLYFSSDGTGWNKTGLGTYGDWSNGVFGNSLYFTLFPVGVSFTSLATTSSILTGLPYVLGGYQEIAFLDGFVFTTQKGLLSSKLAYSSTGYSWTVVNLPLEIVQGDLLYANFTFMMVSGDSSYALVSADLETWSVQLFNNPVVLKNTIYGGGYYLGISSDGTYAVKSSDLVNFTIYPLPADIIWDKIKYNEALNTCVVTGYSPTQNKSYFLKTTDFFVSSSISGTVYSDKRIYSLTTGLLAYTPLVTPVTPATPVTPITPTTPTSPATPSVTPTTPATPVTPTAPPPAPPQYYSGFGFIIIDGTANVTARYELTISREITYAVLAELNKQLPIQYQIGQVITYGYRVEGQCSPLKQPQTPFTATGTTCNSRSLNLIFATSTKAVCQELIRQNWIWPIKSMKKYSKPVYKSEENLLIASGKYDPEIVKFIDITNFCDEPACLDFCVNYLIEEAFNVEFYGGLLDSFILGSGAITVYGSAGVRTKIQKYTYKADPNGSSIVLSGFGRVNTTGGKTYYWLGQGTVVIGGSTGIANYLGEFVAEFNGYMIAEEYTQLFVTTEGSPLEPLPSNTALSKCGCINLFRRLSLITNLNKVSDFYYFLNRNGLSFDETLLSYYNESVGSYNYAQHFKGISTNVNAKETWTVAAEISCAQDLDNFDDNQVWILDLYFRKYTVGYNDLDTNIQVWIPSNLMCPASRGRQVYFSLQINVKTKTCLINDTTVIQNIYINDQINLFKSTGWLDDPILSIFARGVI